MTYKTIALWLLLAILVTHGCGYNRFNVAKSEARPDIGNAVNTLVKLDYKIDRVDSKMITTKWEYLFLDPGTWYEQEILSRIVIDLENGVIKGQCLTRKTQGPWYFTKCYQRDPLHRMKRTVDLLTREVVL